MVTEIKTLAADGSVQYRDSSGNIIITIESTGRRVAIPSGATLQLGGVSLSAALQSVEITGTLTVNEDVVLSEDQAVIGTVPDYSGGSGQAAGALALIGLKQYPTGNGNHFDAIRIGDASGPQGAELVFDPFWGSGLYALNTHLIVADMANYSNPNANVATARLTPVPAVVLDNARPTAEGTATLSGAVQLKGWYRPTADPASHLVAFGLSIGSLAAETGAGTLQVLAGLATMRFDTTGALYPQSGSAPSLGLAASPWPAMYLSVPTSDPGVAGAVWSDSLVLKVSAG